MSRGRSRTAGALDDYKIDSALQAIKTFQHRRHQFRLQRRIFARPHCRQPASLHDHLRAHLAFRLEQDRIHVGVRLDPAGQRLQRLCAPDLAAVSRDGRVVGHVLRLEGGDLETAYSRGAAQPCYQQRLAHIGARALDHQRAHGIRTRRPAGP
jgi:hypothetical protein